MTTKKYALFFSFMLSAVGCCWAMQPLSSVDAHAQKPTMSTIQSCEQGVCESRAEEAKKSVQPSVLIALLASKVGTCVNQDNQQKVVQEQHMFAVIENEEQEHVVSDAQVQVKNKRPLVIDTNVHTSTGCGGCLWNDPLVRQSPSLSCISSYCRVTSPDKYCSANWCP